MKKLCHSIKTTNVDSRKELVKDHLSLLKLFTLQKTDRTSVYTYGISESKFTDCVSVCLVYNSKNLSVCLQCVVIYFQLQSQALQQVPIQRHTEIDTHSPYSQKVATQKLLRCRSRRFFLTSSSFPVHIFYYHTTAGMMAELHV